MSFLNHQLNKVLGSMRVFNKGLHEVNDKMSTLFRRKSCLARATLS